MIRKYKNLGQLFISLFLSLLPTLLFCLMIAGCARKFSFVEGEYVSSNEVVNTVFSRVKLELYHIDEQTYSEAKGVNVICDATRAGDNRYFSFDLYVCVDELNEYHKVDVNEFAHVGGPQQVYNSYPSDGDCYTISGTSHKISTIFFEYQSFITIVICQNDMEYYSYRMSLINNIE